MFSLSPIIGLIWASKGKGLNLLVKKEPLNFGTIPMNAHNLLPAENKVHSVGFVTLSLFFVDFFANAALVHAHTVNLRM